MNILALALTSCLATPDAKIVAASIFKNGYAMVMREIEVSGIETSLTKVPLASLGSFWVTTSEGLKLKSMINTIELEDVKSEPMDVLGVLRLNVGKQVSVTYSVGAATPNSVAGTLTSMNGSLALVRNSDTTFVIPAKNILGATIQGDVAFSARDKRERRVLRFSTEGTGKIYMVGLEQGVMWSPGYAVDIARPNKLRFQGKCTIVNDLGNLDNAEVRLVTGFPNVPWASLSEPLLSGESVNTLVAMLGSLGLPQRGFSGRSDSPVLNQAPALGISMDDMAITGLGGKQNEDLFFYRQPNVTLKKGDRGFFRLFEAESDFQHEYTLDIPDTILSGQVDESRPAPTAQLDIWHTLKFKNTANQPLTTAPATVYKDGQILGQDTLMYTTAGTDAVLKISKALDIRNEVTDEVTKRDRFAINIPNFPKYDMVHITGTLMLKNNKTDDAQMKISKLLTGETTAISHGGKVTKTAKGLRQVNSHSQITWNLKLAKGESKTLTYSYQLYVPSGG